MNTSGATKKLTATIKAKGTLTGSIKRRQRLQGVISKPQIIGTAAEKYEGDVIITPLAYQQQSLETAGKLVETNITVKEIPIAEVTNISGGKTVIIG